MNQKYPTDSYEILIVDNGSQDDTHTRALEFVQEIPPKVSYVYEPRVGVSIARNTGASLAKGEIIAYIDDDAIAEPGWLNAIAKIFSADPAVICVGGRIELWWEAEKPKWLGAELEGYLGGNASLGNQTAPFPQGKYPFGGNLAIRKEAFLRVPGGFDPSFGHTGNRLGAHDETRMVDHLCKIGKIIYSPEACIHHFTPVHRATHHYLVKRAYQIGKADAELDQQRIPRSRFGLTKSFLVNLAFLAGDISRCAWQQIFGRKDIAAREFVQASSRFGRLGHTLKMVILPS